jgi:predicted site-specific integrase-resolvase
LTGRLKSHVEKAQLFHQSEGIQMRIAIYARVSTDERGQDPENQLRELRTWCATAGHEIAHEYIDYESGRKGAKGRKQFAQLFEDAHRRKFDCACCSGRWTASPAKA